MKKILFRKILLDCLTFFLISLLATSIIIWIFQAVNFLDIMIEDGRSYLTYIKYTLLNFPKIVSKILPFVLFFSFMFVIIKYEQNNELIILWNFGVHKIEFVNFFFKFSILITIIQILFIAVIVPSSQNTARSLIRNSEINFFESFIKPKKFIDTIKGITIYVENKDNNGNLENIYLEKNSSSDNFQITYAKKGVFVLGSNRNTLVLYDGQTISNTNNKINNYTFSKSDFNLSQFDTQTIKVIKTQETSSKQLINCINVLSNKKKINDNNKSYFRNCNLRNKPNIFKELYKRFVIPLYLPLLILVSLLLIIKSKESTSYAKYKITIFLLGFFVIIFSETTLRLVENSYSENIKLIIIPILIVFIIYSIFFFKLGSKTR